MDISSIPRTFWHAISLSVVVLSVGFIVIAYKSAMVSIEVANTKISLSQAALEVQDASSDLRNKLEQIRQVPQSSGFGPSIFGSDMPSDCAGLDPTSKKYCETLQGLDALQTDIEQANAKAVEALEKAKSIGE